MIMAELATLSQNKTLKLPADIAEHFHPSGQFVVWLDRDTLHLKRLPPSPLKAAANAPVEEPLSLDEINDIVHEVRKQRSQDVSE